MNPYNVTGPSNSQVAQVESIVSQRLKGSFLWMVVGLLTTIGVGFAALAIQIGCDSRTKTSLSFY